MAKRSFGQFVRNRYPTGLQALIDAQGGRCAYCHRDFAPPHLGRSRVATVEHVYPRHAGHGNVNNVVAACRGCNSAKNGRMPTGCERIALDVVNAKRPPFSVGSASASKG